MFKNCFKTILLALFFLTTFNGFSQSKNDEIAKKLVGSWKFREYFRPYIEPHYKENKDYCLEFIQYTFQADGTVSFKNMNSGMCPLKESKARWSIVKLHAKEGKEYFGVRIFEEGVAERPDYDGNTYNDKVYLLTNVKGKFMQWIPKPQYDKASDRDFFQVFDRIKEENK